jgi:hypothetical protein
MSRPGQGAERDTRPRGKRPINVWVTPLEHDQIRRHAEAAGQSMSAYLRSLGLGYQPRSALDLHCVRELLASCGDLGRLGGLLKLWLVDKPGQGASASEVRRLLDAIGELRSTIAEKALAL